MPHLWPRPITLESVLVHKSLHELLDILGKVDLEWAPWFEELEQIYHLISDDDWNRLLDAYEALEKKIILASKKGLRDSAHRKLQPQADAAWKNLIQLSALRMKYFERHVKANPGCSADELDRRALSSLQRLLSGLSIEEKSYYAKFGLTFDEPAEGPASLTTITPTFTPSRLQQKNGSFPLAISPLVAPSRAELSAPSLRTKLLPPSFSAFLTTSNQASLPPWTTELEAIYNLIAPDSWNRLESEYAALMARLCEARGRRTAEALALQDKATSAWQGSMQLHVMRERYLARFRLLQKGPASLGRGPSLPSLPSLEAQLATEELAYYSGERPLAQPSVALADGAFFVELGLDLRTTTEDAPPRYVEAQRLSNSQADTTGRDSPGALSASPRQQEVKDSLT